MAGSAWRETRLALAGTLILARGDARGLGYFDASLGGFWPSFRAAPICFPLYLALTAGRVDAVQWQAAGGIRIFAVETIGYVISWTAFPLIILSLCRRLQRDGHFLGFMTAYNWCQVPQIALFAAIAAAQATGLVGDGLAQALALMAVAAVLVYEWYIARVALDVAVTPAILVVMVDLLLAALLRQVGESLY